MGEGEIDKGSWMHNNQTPSPQPEKEQLPASFLRNATAALTKRNQQNDEQLLSLPPSPLHGYVYHRLASFVCVAFGDAFPISAPLFTSLPLLTIHPPRWTLYSFVYSAVSLSVWRSHARILHQNYAISRNRDEAEVSGRGH